MHGRDAFRDRPNLQMGLLRRLINDQIRTVQRTNLVQAASSPSSLKRPASLCVAALTGRAANFEWC
jgi:hypothetical protein